MDVRQAYTEALKMNHGQELDSCYECGNFYVFSNSESLGALTVIDKNTGEGKFMQAFMLPFDDFLHRKNITDFK